MHLLTFPSLSNNNLGSESPKHFSFSICSGHRESREDKLILNIWKEALNVLVQHNQYLQPPWVWLKPRLCYCCFGAHPSVKCPEISQEAVWNAVMIFLAPSLEGFKGALKGVWAFHKWMRSVWHRGCKRQDCLPFDTSVHKLKHHRKFIVQNLTSQTALRAARSEDSTSKP